MGGPQERSGSIKYKRLEMKKTLGRRKATENKQKPGVEKRHRVKLLKKNTQK